MGEMSYISKEGDTKVIWDPDNDDEVQNAKDQFETLIDKGFKAFEVGRKGRKTNDEVTKFDRNLEKLIFVPQAVGG